MLKQLNRITTHTKCIAAIILMSLLDAIFTLIWIDLEVGEEANPLLEYILTFGFEYFVGFKISLTVLGCAILYTQRKHPLASKSTMGLLAMYTGLIMYHLIGASLAFLN